MLPAKQYKTLDAAMQSLRTSGLLLEWHWRDAQIGWACVGMAGDKEICELRPTEEPLVGIIQMDNNTFDAVKKSKDFPAAYKGILEFPIEETKKLKLYEFPLSSTQERDLFSAFVESLKPLLLSL